jgi:hypothetical protein
MVKIYAQFDSARRIQSLTALAAPAEFELTLAAEPGSSVAEVEGIELEEAEVHDPEKLREIIALHKSVEAFPRVRLT